MLHKSHAISLSSFSYRETSVIARFFTEEHGLLSVIATGVRTGKTRFSPSLFQPLMPSELVHSFKSGTDLHRLSEIRPIKVPSGISLHPVKSAMAIFVAEFLSKALRDQLENKPLYQLIYKWIYRLDSATSGFESAHLALLWHSFSCLGIAPASWKDLLPEGTSLVPDEVAKLDYFFESEDVFHPLGCSPLLKQRLLDYLINYAGSQLEGLGEIKSLAVLRQVFS